MALDAEMQTYQRELSRLLAQEGRFVVIHGDRILGTFDTYQDALQAGYQSVGLQPFLVKRIEAVEQAHTFTRDINACRT